MRFKCIRSRIETDGRITVLEGNEYEGEMNKDRPRVILYGKEFEGRIFYPSRFIILEDPPEATPDKSLDKLFEEKVKQSQSKNY